VIGEVDRKIENQVRDRGLVRPRKRMDIAHSARKHMRGVNTTAIPNPATVLEAPTQDRSRADAGPVHTEPLTRCAARPATFATGPG
jgi:hypothetical protein